MYMQVDKAIRQAPKRDQSCRASLELYTSHITTPRIGESHINMNYTDACMLAIAAILHSEWT